MYRTTLVVLVFLVGCTPSPDLHTTTKTIPMRHSAYLGKKINLFILGTGVPYTQKKQRDGSIVYAWNSRKPFDSRIRAMEEDHWMDGECEVRIYAKSDGHITAIYALENSAQDWDVDACAKYLK